MISAAEIMIVVEFLDHLKLDINDFPCPGAKRHCCPLEKASAIFADLINEVYFPIVCTKAGSHYHCESRESLGDLGQFMFRLHFNPQEEED